VNTRWRFVRYFVRICVRSMKRMRSCESLPCYWSSKWARFISLHMLKQGSNSLHTRVETFWSHRLGCVSNFSLQMVHVVDFDTLHCFIYYYYHHLQGLNLSASSVLKHQAFFLAFLDYVVLSVDNIKICLGISSSLHHLQFIYYRYNLTTWHQKPLLIT
jgi:hypothetical protein